MHQFDGGGANAFICIYLHRIFCSLNLHPLPPACKSVPFCHNALPPSQMDTASNKRVRMLCLLTRRQGDEEDLWQRQQEQVAYMKERLATVCPGTAAGSGQRQHMNRGWTQRKGTRRVWGVWHKQTQWSRGSACSDARPQQPPPPPHPPPGLRPPHRSWPSFARALALKAPENFFHVCN